MPSNSNKDATQYPEVTYAPSRVYVDKHLAPERIRSSVIVEAGKATRTAVDKGVISPDLAKYVLPNILTEGREDYGVNNGVFNARDPNVKKVVDALGLAGNVTDKKQGAAVNTLIAKTNAMNPASSSPIPPTNSGMLEIHPQDPRPGTSPGETIEDAESLRSADATNAKLMTAVLGIKQSQTTTPEDAIRKWNGRGPGATKHLNKVLNTADMLNDPANATIVKLFQDAYNSAGAAPQQQSQPATEGTQ